MFEVSKWPTKCRLDQTEHTNTSVLLAISFELNGGV